MINVFSPSLNKEELAQVSHSFESGWIGKGEKVRQFEEAWARHIGVSPENVVSVNCATEGLFQICNLARIMLSNLFEYSEVIIPSVHFIGAANAIIGTQDTFGNGFDCKFCDVDKYTSNTFS